MKKAQIPAFQLVPLLWTLVAVAVLIFLLVFLNSLKDKDVYETQYLSAQAAGIIDTALIPQGTTVFLWFHPQKPGFEWDYSFLFEKNKVSVYGKDQTKESASSYPYTSDPAVKVEETELLFKENMVFPVFLRQGDELRIFDFNKETPPINKFKHTCALEPVDLGAVTLDPGHGYNAQESRGDPGVQFEQFRESELAREISQIITTNQLRQIYKSTTRSLTVDQDTKSAVTTKSVLSIHLNDAEADLNVVKAYVNAQGAHLEDSMKYACELINSLTDVYLEQDIPVTGAAIIPVVPAQKTDESFKVLTRDKIGVLLEVGNIRVLNQQQSLIARGVIDAS